MVGARPAAASSVFDLLGARASDTLDDLFPRVAHRALIHIANPDEVVAPVSGVLAELAV